MVKTVLLTGHTGFLGSVIYQELKKDFNVVTMGRNECCDYVVDFSRWYGDVELSEPVEAIVHVAGLAHNKAKNKSEIDKVNFGSTVKLLDLAEKNKIENFIFISSVNVYGNSVGELISESS